LISRAVAGLEKGTAESRRALYDRARTALVDQLRGVTPALSESDITRERLALEEAIRKVESESIRQQRPLTGAATERRPAAPTVQPTEEPPPAPSIDTTAPGAAAETAAEIPPARSEDKTAREQTRPAPQIKKTERRWLDKKPVPVTARTVPESTTPPQRVGREVEQPSVPTPEEFEPERTEARPGPEMRRATPRPRPPERRTLTPKDMDLGIDALESNEPPYRPTPPRTLEPPFDSDGMDYVERARRDQDEEHGVAPVARRMMNGLVAIVIAAVLIALVGATAYWQRHNLLALVSGGGSERAATSKPQTDTSQQRAKISDRVGQQDNAQQQAEAPVAQHVVLYEEDPADSAGKRFVGTALWRTEMAAPSAGVPPEPTVRADITIPERGMQVTWSLRRNTDKDLPASHTISIMFNLPPDFPHGEVAEIRGVLMKQSEQARGVSLAGLSVKVTTGFFLIGLSSTDADMQRNIQMLKERGWFDIAIVYKDGRRAILAVEKGTPGDRAFGDGFAAWGQ
jgi:hypothetical protein